MCKFNPYKQKNHFLESLNCGDQNTFHWSVIENIFNTANVVTWLGPLSSFNMTNISIFRYITVLMSRSNWLIEVVTAHHWKSWSKMIWKIIFSERIIGLPGLSSVDYEVLKDYLTFLESYYVWNFICNPHFHEDIYRVDFLKDMSWPVFGFKAIENKGNIFSF